MKPFVAFILTFVFLLSFSKGENLNWDGYNIRVYVHRISDNNGNGGISNEQLNDYMNHLKNVFKEYDIYVQWLNPGSIDEIHNDLVASNQPDFETLWGINPHSDAIDIYFGVDEPVQNKWGNTETIPSLHLWILGSSDNNVLIHEFGHCLGLYHTYQQGGDGCDDTEPDSWIHRDKYINCNHYQACPNCEEEVVPENIYKNYMSNSPWNCKELFTSCQTEKMKGKMEYDQLFATAACEAKRLYAFNRTLEQSDNLGGTISVDDLSTNSSDYDFPHIPSGSSEYMAVNDNFIAKTNDEKLNNKKHIQWWDKREQYFLESEPFAFSDHNEITAFFKVQENAAIKYMLQESSEYTGGTVEIHDPWYVDINGNQPDDFKPFTFTSNGLDYSVFLEQSGPSYNWNPPYYSVQAEAQQTFTAHGQNITGYFHHWGGNGVDYQSSNNRETPVVFLNQNAQAVAKYKGHLASGLARATGYNNGRRIAEYNNKLHMVYQDNDEIWYTYSSNNGQTWSKETRISPRTYTDGSGRLHTFINPSIAASNGFIYVVWEEVIKNGSSYYHYITFRKKSVYGGNWSSAEHIGYSGWVSNTTPMRPSIAAKSGQQLLVAWRDKSTGKIKATSLLEDEWSDIYTFSSAYGYPNAIYLSSGNNPLVLVWGQSNKIKYVAGYRSSTSLHFGSIKDLTSGLPSYYGEHKRPSACADGNGIGYVAWEAYDAVMLQNVILYQCYRFDNNGQLFGGLTVVASEEGGSAQSHLLNATVSYDDASHKTTIFYQFNNTIYRKQKSGSNWTATNYGSGKYPSVAAHADLGAVWTRYTSAPYLLKTENSNTYLTKTSALPVAVVKRFYYDGKEVSVVELSDFTMNGKEYLFDDTLTTEALAFSGSDAFNYRLDYVTKNYLDETPVLLFTSGERVMNREDLDWSEANTVSASGFTYVQDVAATEKVRLKFSGSEPFVVTVVKEGKEAAKAPAEPLVYGSVLPQRYALSANYPNPFNPTTRIRVSLPEAAWVDLAVYNLAGQKVAQLLSGRKPAGIYQVVFDGSGLASGVYIYLLRANDFTAVKRMLLVK